MTLKIGVFSSHLMEFIPTWKLTEIAVLSVMITNWIISFATSFDQLVIRKPKRKAVMDEVGRNQIALQNILNTWMKSFRMWNANQVYPFNTSSISWQYEFMTTKRWYDFLLSSVKSDGFILPDKWNGFWNMEDCIIAMNFVKNEIQLELGKHLTVIR